MIGKFFRWLFREGEYRMPASPTNEYYVNSKYGREGETFEQMATRIADDLKKSEAKAAFSDLKAEVATDKVETLKKKNKALTKTLTKTKVNGKPVVKKTIKKRAK
jgi:hypothetical protein